VLSPWVIPDKGPDARDIVVRRGGFQLYLGSIEANKVIAERDTHCRGSRAKFAMGRQDGRGSKQLVTLHELVKVSLLEEVEAGQA
jgi:hypothetical protein